MQFSKARSITILLADDDADDRLLTQDALKESKVLNRLFCVEDGVALLQYLRREGKYNDKERYPWPSLILLDLNMPRMDGREALQQLKEDPELRSIPVVILTTSKQEEDMIKGYGLGAASFITKPVDFTGLVELMRAIGNYWVEFVELPNTDNECN
jgi:two-component system response regulator